MLLLSDNLVINYNINKCKNDNFAVPYTIYTDNFAAACRQKK